MNKKFWLITTSYPRHPDEAINAGILARQTARQLIAAGHSVTVVTPDKPGGVVFDPDLDHIVLHWWHPRVEMASLRAQSPRDLLSMWTLLWRARAALRSAATSVPPDAVIALWGLPSGYFADLVARQTGAPYAVWLLGSDVWLANQFPFGARLLRAIASRARLVAADSPGLVDMAEALTSARVEFLPSSVALPVEPRLPRNDLTLGFVGRYHRNKGPDLAVLALVELQKSHPSIKLEMHGSGDMRQDLVRLVARLDLETSVHVGEPLGRKALASKLATWTALLIPSRQESVPMILSDAVQARIPVVATDVGDLGVACSSYDVAFVASPSPTALAAATVRAIAGSAQGSATSAAALAFDPHRATSRFIEALHS